VEAATGEDRPVWLGGARHDGAESDLDLLVIKGGKFNRWRLLTRIYQRLRGKDAALMSLS